MYPQNWQLANELIRKFPKDIEEIKPFEVVNQHQKLLLFRLDFSTYSYGVEGGIILYKEDYTTEDAGQSEEYIEFLVDKNFIIDLKSSCGIGGGFPSFILNADDRNHHYETSFREIDIEEFIRSVTSGSLI